MAIIESEKELEDYLYNEAGLDDGKWSDYLNDGKMFRQINITGYGIIDLLYIGFDMPTKNFDYPDVKITIIELKKDQIDYKALEQLSRYRTAVGRYLEELCESSPKKFTYTIEGFLVGNKIDIYSDFVYLIDNIDWLTVFTYSVDLSDGLILQEDHFGWYAKREDFNSLKIQLSEIMPTFLSAYKIWHNYNLQEKRNKQQIIKAR